MKCLLSCLLAGIAGLAAFSFPTQAAMLDEADRAPVAAAAEDCSSADCDVTVERISDDLCRVECEGPDGERCWMIVACDVDGECEVIDCGGEGCEPCEPSGEACTKGEACAESEACTVVEACAPTACSRPCE